MSIEDTERLQEFEQDIECSICTEPLDQPTVIADCGHEFCKACIENWQENNGDCPFCRGEIRALIKVPKLDLIVENYLFLLERERNFLKRNEKFMKQKEKLQEIMNAAMEKNLEIKEIEELLGVSTGTIEAKEEVKEVAKEEKDDKKSRSSSESAEEDDSRYMKRRHRRTWKYQDSHQDFSHFNHRRKRLREKFYKEGYTKHHDSDSWRGKRHEDHGTSEYRGRGRRGQRGGRDYREHGHGYKKYNKYEGKEEDKEARSEVSEGHEGYRGRGRRGKFRGHKYEKYERNDDSESQNSEYKHRKRHDRGHRGNRGYKGHRGGYRGENSLFEQLDKDPEVIPSEHKYIRQADHARPKQKYKEYEDSDHKPRGRGGRRGHHHHHHQERRDSI